MIRQLIGTLLVWAAVGVACAAEATPEPWVEQALAQSPTLDALHERIDAVQQRAARAGVLPEPMVAVEYSNMPVTEPYPGNHAMSGVQLKLQQTFPFPGTVPRRVDAAQGRVAVVAASLDEGRVELAARVRGVFWRLTLTRQLRLVTEEHVALTGQLIDTVRASYEVGRAGQHELLGLQVLRDRLEDDLGDYDRAERELLAVLAAAVHQRGEPMPQLAVETPPSLSVEPPPTDLGFLRERAATDSPTLQRLAATAEAELRAAESARREAYPDLTLWAGYRVRAPVGEMDDGTNQMSLGMSVPLPTAAAKRWGRTEAEHEALARSANAQAEATLDRLAADIDGAVARWERGAGKATRYRDELIPTARSALDATLAAYQVDRADFASLYRAEVQLLELERAARTAQIETRLAQVALWQALGVALVPGDDEDGGS